MGGFIWVHGPEPITIMAPSWQGSVAVSRHSDRTAESSHLERKEAESTLGMAQAFKTSKSTPGNAFSNKASLLPPGTPQTALPTEYSAKPETSKNIASHHRVLLGAPGHKFSGDGAPGCLSEAQHVFPNLSYRDISQDEFTVTRWLLTRKQRHVEGR